MTQLRPAAVCSGSNSWQWQWRSGEVRCAARPGIVARRTDKCFSYVEDGDGDGAYRAAMVRPRQGPRRTVLLSFFFNIITKRT